MTRWANAPNDTAAGKPAVAMVTLCELNFASATLYLNDGCGTLNWNGHDYQGLGQYGSAEGVDEDLQQTAKALKLTLSGVDPSLVSSAMTEDYQGRVVTLLIGLLDINTLAWIANPEIVWEGRMDFMTIDIAQGGATIAMHCESRLFIEPRVARYTDQDQQLAHSGDNFFNLLWQISHASATWGSVNVTHPATTPPHRNPHTSVKPPFIPWVHP